MVAALHYAMIACRRRWERIEDMRIAACFPHYEEKARAALINRINLMTGGPGTVIEWEQTLDPKVRRALDECDKERDEVYESLKAAGLLCQADGARPISKVLGR